MLSGRGSDETLDEPVEERVERSEVGGRHGDEDHGHHGSLNQGLAVGPLDALELGPAGDEEADDPAPLARFGGLGRSLAALGGLATPALALLLLVAPGAAADLVLGRGVGDRRVLRLADVGAWGRGGAEPSLSLFLF